MKDYKLVLILAALPAVCGCASFNSGDLRVERDTARAMRNDRTITPFSELQVSWRNFPYRAPTDSIGEGSVSNPKKIKPVPALPEDTADLARLAGKVLAEAGLYDKAKGRGELRLELTTFGKWTYGDLFHSFLVDTGFIFLIPASLRVNYFLTADFAVSTGAVRVETEARNKTTFHLLLAPLYPFCAPGSREHSLLKQMLRRSAAEIYARLKAAGGVPGTAALPPAARSEPPENPAPVPAVEPSRDWNTQPPPGD